MILRKLGLRGVVLFTTFVLIFIILLLLYIEDSNHVDVVLPSNSNKHSNDDDFATPIKNKNNKKSAKSHQVSSDTENVNENLMLKLQTAKYNQLDYYLPPMNRTLRKAFSNFEYLPPNSWCAMNSHAPNSKCFKFFAKASQRFFRLHHMHQHAFSIERKVVRLFGPVLARYFCSSILEKRGEVVVAGGDGNNFIHKALVVDVGVNDAEDISYWFEKFGYFDGASIFSDSAVKECKNLLFSSSSSLKAQQQPPKMHIDFRLFEPQQMYWDQIKDFLKKQLGRKDVFNETINDSEEDAAAKKKKRKESSSSSLSSFMTIHGAFDAVAVSSDADHGSTALFYGQGEQASLGSKGKHAAKGKPVEVKLGSLAKMLNRKDSWTKTDLEGDGIMNHHQGQDGSSSKNEKTGSGDEGTTDSSNNNVKNDGPILFMKVDCEGADPTILIASEELFESHRVQLLVFELHKNEKGFPKKFVHSVEMLTKHNYEVYLLGRCHHLLSSEAPKDALGKKLQSLMLLKMDSASLASQWSPVLEAGIAISPQMQKIMKKDGVSVASYFGGGKFGLSGSPKCGSDWEFIPYF